MAEALDKALITGEIASSISQAYLSRVFKDSQSVGGISFGINCRSFKPLNSYQEAYKSMNKSCIDLTQLKAGVGTRLKKKREPLSPASISSSKMKATENLLEGPLIPPTSKKKDVPLIENDCLAPSSLTTMKEVEKISRVEETKASPSRTPLLPIGLFILGIS